MDKSNSNSDMARRSSQPDNFVRDFSVLCSDISVLTLANPTLPSDIPPEMMSKPFHTKAIVPTDYYGSLIGNRGWHSREIELFSHAMIWTRKERRTSFQVLWIFGDREEHIYRAKKVIQEYIMDEESSIIKSFLIPIEFAHYFCPGGYKDPNNIGYLNSRRIKVEAGVLFFKHDTEQPVEHSESARFLVKGPPANADLAIAMAFDKIREIRAEKEQQKPSKRRARSKKTPQYEIQIWVDRSYLRGLLGKDRGLVKEIEKSTGTKIWIDEFEEGALIPIFVDGKKDEDVFRAKKLINRYISDQERSVHKTGVVPSALADHFRPQGCQIGGRDIKRESGVEYIKWIEDPTTRETMFDIRGTPENVDLAIGMVNDQVRELLAQMKEKEMSKKVEE